MHSFTPNVVANAGEKCSRKFFYLNHVASIRSCKDLGLCLYWFTWGWIQDPLPLVPSEKACNGFWGVRALDCAAQLTLFRSHPWPSFLHFRAVGRTGQGGQLLYPSCTCLNLDPRCDSVGPSILGGCSLGWLGDSGSCSSTHGQSRV